MREHENTLLSLQTTLISLEDKIEEKKLTIATLKNRNADKEKITLEQKRLNSLVAQKQITQKDIASEKKIIEKIQKKIETFIVSPTFILGKSWGFYGEKN